MGQTHFAFFQSGAGPLCFKACREVYRGIPGTIQKCTGNPPVRSKSVPGIPRILKIKSVDSHPYRCRFSPFSQLPNDLASAWVCFFLFFHVFCVFCVCLCVLCASRSPGPRKEQHERGDELYIESAPVPKKSVQFRNVRTFPPNSYTILKRIFAFTMRLPPKILYNLCANFST